MSTDYRTEEWVDRLIAMADASGIPDSSPPDADWMWTDVDFDLPDGWKMTVFYDGGDVDYIDHFVAPDGTVIDFWEWPDESIDEPTAGDLLKLRLMAWSGCQPAREETAS